MKSSVQDVGMKIDLSVRTWICSHHGAMHYVLHKNTAAAILASLRISVIAYQSTVAD